MKWRFGIREKFALVATALVVVVGYVVRAHLFPATSRIVVEHELLDLADEAELRCWEMIDWINQLRSETAEAAVRPEHLQALLANLKRKKEEPPVLLLGDSLPPQWWDVILDVRVIHESGQVDQLFQVDSLKVPGVPQLSLNVSFGHHDQFVAPHVSQILAADLPLGYLKVRDLGPTAKDAPVQRVPVMWGLCKIPPADPSQADTPELQNGRLLAILVPLERSRSARHFSYLLDDKGNFLQHPAVRADATVELNPTTYNRFNLFSAVEELNAKERWGGVESNAQVQRGRDLHDPQLATPIKYLIGQATEELMAKLKEDDQRDSLGLDLWNDQIRLDLERERVRFGGASMRTGMVRLMTRNPEVMEAARRRVTEEYGKRYPGVKKLFHWQEMVNLSRGDVQLVRFYLRLTPEEREGGMDSPDPAYYFAYAAFREELDAAVAHEFHEVEREGWLLGLASGVVAFLVALFFLRPLGRITKAAQKVTEDGGQVLQLQHQIETVRQSLPVRKHDEVGEIARALESLLRQVINGHQRLRQSNADLELYKDELEHKVQDRTRQLTEANEELLGLAAAKDAFLASVSHELRQPLNSIFGYLQFLEMSELDTEQTGDVKKLRSAATYLRRLIDDILDYQKIIIGGVELDVEPIDAEEFFSGLEDAMTPQARERGNTLAVHLSPGIGTLHHDRARLQQIFVNLLSNACKFTEQGTVSVHAKVEKDAADRDWLVVAVQDTGRGMKPEEKKSLFVKFKKLAAREGNKTGTGLGLVISKGLCELMQGTITCESEYGQGTTFTVRLPKDLPSSPEGDGPTPQPFLGSSVGAALSVGGQPVPLQARVLVIDDDPSVREMMERFLTGKGYQVTTAPDGELGITAAVQQKPRVIVLDVVLPGRDGWQILAELKTDPRTAEIPVIMMTFMEEQGRGYALGAADYLVKPIVWSVLSQRIQQALGQGPITAPILVVDDDPETQEIFTRALEKDGLQTLRAAHGEEALRLLETHRPALILLDLMMPVMDGFEFVEALQRHSDWREIPIIVVTAKHPTPEDRARLEGRVRTILEKGGSTRDHLLGDILAFVHRYAPPQS